MKYVGCKIFRCFVKLFTISQYCHFAKRLDSLVLWKQGCEANETFRETAALLTWFAKQKSTSSSNCLAAWCQLQLFYFATVSQNVGISQFREKFRENGCATNEKFREIAAHFACFAVSLNSNTPFRQKSWIYCTLGSDGYRVLSPRNVWVTSLHPYVVVANSTIWLWTLSSRQGLCIRVQWFWQNFRKWLCFM